MKKHILFTLCLAISTLPSFSAENADDITLNKPNLKRGGNIMETLSQRQSSREFSTKEVSLTDLSDILWAANGVSREDGKRTAPSAMNKQEITIYAFMKSGVYEYDFKNHTLVLAKKGDYRKLVASSQEDLTSAPLHLVYVADIDELSNFGERNLSIASMDAGIVCQNVNLFCASADIATVPRITMDVKGIKELLNLSKNEIPLMNNVIGYKK